MGSSILNSSFNALTKHPEDRVPEEKKSNPVGKALIAVACIVGLLILIGAFFLTKKAIKVREINHSKFVKVNPAIQQDDSPTIIEVKNPSVQTRKKLIKS